MYLYVACARDEALLSLLQEVTSASSLEPTFRGAKPYDVVKLPKETGQRNKVNPPLSFFLTFSSLLFLFFLEGDCVLVENFRSRHSYSSGHHEPFLWAHEPI